MIVESQEAGLEVSKGERQYVAITTSSAAASSSAAAAAASKASRTAAAALESAIETATGGAREQEESAEELLRHQNVEFTVENVMHHTGRRLIFRILSQLHSKQKFIDSSPSFHMLTIDQFPSRSVVVDCTKDSFITGHK